MIGPFLVFNFWPNFTAPLGQYSTHLPQATHLSISICAVYALLDILGVLNNCEVLKALQILTLQLQIAKILFSPSMLVI